LRFQESKKSGLIRRQFALVACYLCLVNLEKVLAAGGSRLDLVVNTTVLVADISNFQMVNAVFSEFFAEDPPARMTMQVPLPPGFLFSIACVAAVDE
jgi:enamine deaminase RidA (YjgF/YER057c/UK114 family)